jgi:naringenin degradation protein FdeI
VRFATYSDGNLDRRLIVVSKDGTRAVAAIDIAGSLLDALQRWRQTRDFSAVCA